MTTIKSNIKIKLCAWLTVAAMVLGIFALAIPIKVSAADDSGGMTFTAGELYSAIKNPESVPHTFEAVIKPKAYMCVEDYSGYDGTLIGFLEEASGQSLIMDVCRAGVRIYMEDANDVDAGVRFDNALVGYGDKKIHVAITVDTVNETVTLYINGDKVREAQNISDSVDYEYWNSGTTEDGKTKFFRIFNELSMSELPYLTVGGDHRIDNSRYFRGTIYSTSLFSDVRTADEVRSDAQGMPSDDAGLLVWYDTDTTDTLSGRSVLVDKSGNGFDIYSSESSYFSQDGMKFSKNILYSASKKVAAMPQTFEATIRLPEDYTEEGDAGYYGTILGWLDDDEQSIIMDSCLAGVRIYTTNAGRRAAGVVFRDVLVDYTNEIIQVAITINPDTDTVTLYINGEKIRDAEEISDQRDYQYNNGSKAVFFDNYESLTIEELPYHTVGGDFRANNSRHFLGEIYSVSAFADVRTPEEISADTLAMPVDDENLLLWYDTVAKTTDEKILIPDMSGNGFNLSSSLIAKHGLTFTADTLYMQNKTTSVSPNTFEAWINLPSEYATNSQRGGVIIGNYNELTTNTNFEITTNGNPRIYADDRRTGLTQYSYVFNSVNVANGSLTHLAIVRDGTSLQCYVDGFLAQTITTAEGFATLPLGGDIPFMLGGDRREDNTQYFKGTIYSVSLYSDARTENEVFGDFLGQNQKDEIIAEYDTTSLVSQNHIPNRVVRGEWISNAGFVEEGLTASSDNYYVLQKDLTGAPNTFEAWIRLTDEELLADSQGRGGVILGSYGSGTSGFNFEVGANGVPRIVIYPDGNVANAKVLEFSNTDVANGQMLHLTIVRDTSAQKGYCYINGVLVETVDFTYVGNIISTEPLAFGGDYRTVGFDDDTAVNNETYFKGHILSASLYSDARTADEVWADYVGEEQCAEMLLWYSTPTITNFVNDKSGNNCSAMRTYPVSGAGMNFTQDILFSSGNTLQVLPKTFEATINMTLEEMEGGADHWYCGTIIGCYGDAQEGIIMDVAHYGPRIYIAKTKDGGAVPVGAGVRFDNALTEYAGQDVHIAITIDPTNEVVTLYINGKKVRDAEVISDGRDYEYTNNGGKDWFFDAYRALPLGEMPLLSVGGDFRTGNTRYFTGTIHNVGIFSDMRTPDEIASDVTVSPTSDANLIAFYNFDSVESFDGIVDSSPNGYGLLRSGAWGDDLASDKVLGTDYSYSFAIIGDTQIIARDYQSSFHKIYDYIIDNKDAKNIQFVFGLGDITDTSTLSAQSAQEWAIASAQIERLNGVVPHSFVRGNHDNLSEFNKYMSYDTYKDYIGGSYDETMLNTWQTLQIGTTNYLILALDYGASDDVLDWASGIVELYPYHNVIVTTHAYLYHDGTTLDENDLNPPTATGGYNNGDDMWDKFIRKHENIVLVISGHDPWNRIVSTHVKGDNGNTVTQLLVNPQGLDESIAPTGMVAMLYFSEDGSDVSVEWYSTIQERYYKSDNQFDIVLPLATTAENPDDIPVESNPAGSTSQGTEIQYGVSKSYIVMVPSVVDFGYGGVSTTSTVSASEVLIDGGTKLVITISSYNDWKMVTENDDDNLPVDYTVNLVKNQPDNSVDILENGDVVLTVPCAAPGLEGEAILYFDNSGTNQAGRYLDLLTFTVAIE